MGVVRKIKAKALMKVLEEELRRIRHEERYVKPWINKQQREAA